MRTRNRPSCHALLYIVLRHCQLQEGEGHGTPPEHSIPERHPATPPSAASSFLVAFALPPLASSTSTAFCFLHLLPPLRCTCVHNAKGRIHGKKTLPGTCAPHVSAHPKHEVECLLRPGVDTNEARHPCRHCHKRFSRTDLLRKHEKTHSARTLSEALLHTQHATTASASPESILTPQIAQTASALETPPFSTTVMEDLGADDTLSFDLSGNREPGHDYGQSLFDFDLAWTFDFLDRNDESQVGFSEPLGDASTTAQGRSIADGRHDMISVEGVLPPPAPNSLINASSLDEDEVTQVFTSSSGTSLRISDVSDELRESLLDVMIPDSHTSSGILDHERQAFPGGRCLQYFLLLYIRLVHPRFPAIHLPTFSQSKTPAVVLMAMMLAGSCHSVSNANRFCYDHLDRCRDWLTAAREKNLKNVSMRNFTTRSWLILASVRQHRPYICAISMHIDRYLEWPTSIILQGRAGPRCPGPRL